MSLPERDQPTLSQLKVIESYAEVMLADTPANLSRCFQGFDDDPVPVLAKILAEHQSHCRVRDLNWPRRYNELYAANPRWHALLAEATVQWSKLRDENREAGDGFIGYSPIHGSYCLVARIDGGGCANVFLAIDRRNAKRVVAKLPRLEVEAALSTIEQERDALLMLPLRDGLPRLLCTERNDENIPALIFAFEQHEPLAKIQDHNEQLVTYWMALLCDALQEAHKAGVYHGDIKPENVLVRDCDSEPLLIDFGLSKTVMRWSHEPEEQAPAIGTPAYFAPELCDPKLEASSVGVDVFGLGATLYALLTGIPPFDAPTCSEATERSRNYDVDWGCLTNAPYSSKIKSICRQAIAKDPAQRYLSPAAMAKALRATWAGRRQRALDRLKPFANWRSAAMLASFFALMIGLFALGRATTPRLSQAVLATALADTPRLSLWKKAAADLGVDPSTITAEDFQISIRCRRRTKPGWTPPEESDPDKGTLVVSTSRRINDLATAIECRLGRRPWQSLYGNVNEVQNRFYKLDMRDLEINGPLSLRLGGDGPFGGGVIAGPFEYEISLKEAVRQDQIAFDRELMARAIDADPFDPKTNRWSMLYDYASKYDEVISKIRFGAAPDRLVHVAFPGEPAKRTINSGFYEDEPMMLHASFAKHSESLRDAPTLWVQLEFIDGSVSKLKRYDRPKKADGG